MSLVMRKEVTIGDFSKVDLQFDILLLIGSEIFYISRYLTEQEFYNDRYERYPSVLPQH